MFCFSCANTNENKKKISMEENKNNIKIELYLYPSGNLNDIRYSVIVDDGILYVENHDPLNGTKIPPNDSPQRLSVAQVEKLEALIKETKFIKEELALVTEDTWGCKLIANKNILFESTSFTYESINDKQKLITYLLSLLPVKLELYGFS